MGTSSIFNGRNDRNSLLPNDYEPNQNENSNVVIPVKWQTVKSVMSKYIKSGGSKGSVRHIVKQYVKASGGSHHMASQANSGLNVGGNIGIFFNGIIANGLDATFKNLGIEYEGKSITEVFSRLVDILAPNSNTKEDIVAKEATRVALAKVFDYVETNGMNIDSLNNMPLELMTTVLKEYVGAYIWITVMKDLESRLEMYIMDSQDSYSTECEFKDMIMGVVDVTFRNKGDIINKNILSTIKELYERCLSVLEGIV